MRKINEIKLKFFQDDATGEFGLAHHNSFDRWDGSNFNAFWDGYGIFHDIFEHWFEDEHKYFKGDNAFNVGGEMAAMGAMYYYVSTLGVHNRAINGNWGMYGMDHATRMTTQGMIEESIKYGYNSYGHTLECGVPYQRPVTYGYQWLEGEVIDLMWNDVKGMPIKADYEQEIEDAKRYKESVTFGKIANLHRWGFRMAKRMINDNNENRITLCNFIEFWNEFCEKNYAEPMHSNYKGITFKLYKEKGIVKWTATFESRYSEIEDYKITSNDSYVPEMYDMLVGSEIY